jgi:hypothetical protein
LVDVLTSTRFLENFFTEVYFFVRKTQNLKNILSVCLCGQPVEAKLTFLMSACALAKCEGAGEGSGLPEKQTYREVNGFRSV